MVACWLLTLDMTRRNVSRLTKAEGILGRAGAGYLLDEVAGAAIDPAPA